MLFILEFGTTSHIPKSSMVSALGALATPRWMAQISLAGHELGDRAVRVSGLLVGWSGS